MSEGEPRAREAIENSSEYDAQRMRAGLKGPYPRRPPQSLVAVQHGRRREGIGGVQIDERLERLRALPERVEGWVVQVFPVSMAIDHSAAEFQLAHRAFELVRGGDGVLHGQMRKARIAPRPLCDFTCDEIVRRPRLVACGLGVTFGLYAGAGDREHAPFVPGTIHRREPYLTEVG